MITDAAFSVFTTDSDALYILCCYACLLEKQEYATLEGQACFIPIIIASLASKCDKRASFPGCGARKNHRAYAVLDFFDRCPWAFSLRPPLAAVECPAQIRRRPLLSDRMSQFRSNHTKQKHSIPQGDTAFLVRVTGFEPAASCSQSRRATNCATPGSDRNSL